MRLALRNSKGELASFGKASEEAAVPLVHLGRDNRSQWRALQEKGRGIENSMTRTIYRCDTCKAFNLAERNMTRVPHLACKRSGLWQPYAGEVVRVQVTSLHNPDLSRGNFLSKGWQTVGAPFVWEGPKETLSDLLDLFHAQGVTAQQISTDNF
jgi:hypothetical protein